MGVLVSCCSCSKLLQTGWLKTPEIHSLTVLEAKSLKSVSLSQNQDINKTVLIKALEEGLFHTFLLADGFASHLGVLLHQDRIVLITVAL